MFFAGDLHLGFAVEHADQGVERGGVLAQRLPGIECKRSHGTGQLAEHFTANDGTGLIFGQFSKRDGFANQVRSLFGFCGGFAHTGNLAKGWRVVTDVELGRRPSQ